MQNLRPFLRRIFFFFFFNDTATTEIYTLSLHDALPIAQYQGVVCMRSSRSFSWLSMCRSKWTIPIFFEVHSVTPRTQGKPIECSPPSINGSTSEEQTC